MSLSDVGFEDYCNAYRKPKRCLTWGEADALLVKYGHGRMFLCEECGAYHISFFEEYQGKV